MIPVTEEEVLEVQKAWGERIVKIGELYLSKGNYKKTGIEDV